jgi:hypothetical protein
MSDPAPYNPLDKKNLGASVAEALLGRKPRALTTLASFHGAGLYAIYYHGEYSIYNRLAQRNSRDDPVAPIYVGKAIPEGARKGGVGSEGSNTRALYKRLSEHADSIRSTATLKIDDFTCRFLVVDDIWIPLGESLLIAKFTPLWNSLIDGFGNHDPGKGRYNGMRPRWDVLHPGRAWAEKCQPRLESAKQVADEILAYLEQTQPPASAHFLVEQSRGKYTVERDLP